MVEFQDDTVRLLRAAENGLKAGPEDWPIGFDEAVGAHAVKNGYLRQIGWDTHEQFILTDEGRAHAGLPPRMGLLQRLSHLLRAWVTFWLYRSERQLSER